MTNNSDQGIKALENFLHLLKKIKMHNGRKGKDFEDYIADSLDKAGFSKKIGCVYILYINAQAKTTKFNYFLHKKLENFKLVS